MIDGGAAQHRDFDLRIKQRQVDAGLHAAERGLILGIEKTRIEVGQVGRLAAPLDRRAWKLDASVLGKLAEHRFGLGLGQQHRMTEMPA
jgi:hypothetical protein